MQHFAPAPQPQRQKQKIAGGLKPDRNDQSQKNAESQPSPDTKFHTPRNGDEVAVTALRIFRPPVRAVVTLREGRPARIACPKRKEMGGEILWAAGPWRSSGDWWEQEGWARDEWDIAVQEAISITLYRLVRDLLSGLWRLEGSYD
jgi:hypothetical protein